MTTQLHKHFSKHIDAVEKSLETLDGPIATASKAIVDCLRKGGKILTLGNGGSAAEASHLAEELVGRYKKDRRPYPAICLTADSGTVTCIANDFGYESLFVRQIDAFAQPGDVAVALTTSGKSENVNRAIRAAHLRGAVTIALTGEAGLRGVEADHVIAVPSSDSAIVQEIHLMVIHLFCLAVEGIV
jgi:D-sedoheptulose 7-phosphate isomerase